MKKVFALLLAGILLLSLSACGAKSSDAKDNSKMSKAIESTPQSNDDKGNTIDSSEEKVNEETKKEPINDNESATDNPSSVLDKVTLDYENVISKLESELKETFLTVGTTYDEYKKNKSFVDDWINLLLTESDNLFERTRENSIIYFKLIAAAPNHKYSEFCEEALDDYYDVICDDTLDEYYDALCDDAMDDLFDEYYDGVVDEAYDKLEFSEWSEASSDCYKTWSDASSAVYKKWSDNSSYFYNLWSVFNSAFCWDDNFDVDAIINEYDKERLTKDIDETESDEKDVDITETDTAPASTDSTEPSGSSSESGKSAENNSESDALSKEFKAAMDSYEAFYDDYCDFMTKYNANPTDSSLIKEYSEIADKLTDMNKKFEEWNNGGMNDEELKYYLEVNNRVTQKLLEVQKAANKDEATSETESIADEEPQEETTSSDGLSPEFKEAMDSYEKFYDEYCEFMIRYKANPTDMKLLTEYVEIMGKLTDMNKKFQEWNNGEMNDEELKYYLEVNNRVTQKLIEVS